MTTCTYKFKDASGEEVTITGQADMKAFLANGGLEQLLPGKVLPWAEKNSLQRDSSWVIKNKKTGEIIMETFDRAKVDALNTEKYEAVPILTHLQSLNGTKSSQPPAITAETPNSDDQPSRDTFLVARYDPESNEVKSESFARGEYVRIPSVDAGAAGKVSFGDIEGVSHAKKMVKVRGVWYSFGQIYKAERPESPKTKTVPMSEALDSANKKYGGDTTEADRILTLADIDTLVAGLNDGTVSADAYKAAWQAFQKSADTIKAGLHKLTKPQLLDKVGGTLAYRMKGENKPEIVASVFKAARNTFALGRNYGPSSYVLSASGMKAHEEAKEKALADLIDATTDEDLKRYADDIAAARAERSDAMDALMESVKDPKTLDDFRTYMRVKGREGKTDAEARQELTPEQRIAYDNLLAEESRNGRAGRKDAQQTEVRAAGQTTSGEVVTTKHTKTGEDLFVVRAADRVDRDIYNQWNAAAKRLGGWYSSYRGGGAVPGFQFKSMESAQAFLKFLGGDVSEAQEVVQQRRDSFADDRSQSAVERLNEMADRMEERADASLSQERKANTERRARMAASAEASASAEKAMAKTMRNIAAAISEGRAKFLDKIRQKTQIEMLASFLSVAKYNELTKRYPSYGDFERHRGEPMTAETADYATFPKYTASRSDLARLGRELELIDGAKLLGQRILKVADDATSEYLAFVKDNIYKVTPFTVNGGKPAIFASRDDAERAIARSSLRGKAMVYPVKRGQNVIVMSPQMAQEKGLWQGGSEKRFTLTDETGEELTRKVAEINARGGKASLPYQFSTTREQRAKLSAIGIETPAEFRAALREFIAMRESAEAPSKIKQLERAMVGRKNDGLDFFPTPAGVAQEMIDAAGIEEGMTVLEPSAGMGHIAEQIRDAGVDPDVAEFSSDRRELLEAKGFRVVGNDFMSITPRDFTYGDVFRDKDGVEGVMRGSGGMGSNRVGFYPLEKEDRLFEWRDRDELVGVRKSGNGSGYDRIIMNPPFSDRRDAEHVRHAFDLLKPGGRIVAIMGEGVFFGQDKKAESFREWLDSVGGSSEKLPDGTFLDPSLPVNTATNARLVVIDKPADAPAVLRDTSALRDGESIPRDQAEAFIRSFVAEFPGAPPIMLADSFSQLPKDLQADAIAQGSSPRRAKGALKAGKAFVVLNNHHSMADLEATVFHEILGHTGTRKLLGPQFSQELNKLFVGLGGYSGLERIMQARGMGQQFEGYFRGIQQARASNPDAWTDALAKSILTEEVFAHIAEQKNAKQLRDRFMALVGMVRDWLRRHGFMDLASLGESDIVFMLQHAREGLRDGSGIVRDGATVGENEIVGEDGRPIAKEGSPEYEALKLLSGRMGLRERSGPTVFKDEPAEESAAASIGDSKQDAAVFRTDTYAQPRGQAAKGVMDNVLSAFKDPSSKVFGTLHTKIATQLHKAWVNKDYGKVFHLADSYERDISRFSADPSAAAPNLLPAFDNIRDAFNRLAHGNANRKHIDGVADAIFSGTLAGEDVTEGRVWNDRELRDQFGMNDEQIGLYHESRNAIDASLDATAAGLAWQSVKKYIPDMKESVKAEAGNAETIIDGAMRALEEELREVAQYQATVEAEGALPEGTAAKTLKKAKDVAEARQAAESIFVRADALKTAGYAPLMRFGRFAVDVVENLPDGTQERIGFYKFETEIEAKMAAQKLQKENPQAEVTRSVMSEEAWKIFKGVDPDLVAMFAETLDGIDGLDVKGEVLQEWYRSAVNDRSSFKRMIHRKGTEGFDRDLTRVVASFITSNARVAARQFNMGDMAQAIADMQDRKVSGDVVDEAVRLKEYMENPTEPFQGLKGWMFAWFLGGSVASAVLNLTQPLMMTLPYLSQFGIAKAGAELAKAAKEAATNNVEGAELKRALLRASKDGKVDPQQVHHLYHEGMRPFLSKLPIGEAMRDRAQGLMTMWGYMFGATENFNRRITFIAAYRMARDNPELGNPYEFAVKAIDETQGIYSKANRPNWARGTGPFGAVGVAAFTFKQYSVGYVELLIRMAKSGKNGRIGAAMMLGTLVMMSGMQGAPGADDLEDIIDTVSQYLGYTGNSRLGLRNYLRSLLGDEAAKIVMYGGLSALPFDIAGRVGLGNLLPATAIFKPSEQNRASQFAEMFGPPLSMSNQVLDAALAMESGSGVGGVANAFAPVAIRNLMKAYDMAESGEYRDTKGRKVTNVSMMDAMYKAGGLQPMGVSAEQKNARLVQMTGERIKQVKGAINSLKARGIVENDQAKRAKADELLKAWNESNPDARIMPDGAFVLRRVKEMNTERRARLMKALPREYRQVAEGEMN